MTEKHSTSDTDPSDSDSFGIADAHDLRETVQRRARRKIDRYYLDDEPIGKGGMGTVYKARDPVLERDVALKIPHVADNERFEREYQILSRFSHPNIVRVFHAGTAGDLRHCFFTMPLLQRNLHDARDQFSSPHEAARLVRTLAEALQAVHDRRVLHRDLKPANILMDGDVPVLADFGLAAASDLDSLTQTNALLGTFQYRSPEQDRGEEVDERSDVFGLGAVLYYLLTECPPTPKVNPEPPKHVPTDLQRIVMKCLESSPGRRYQSASQFGDDLERWLSGRDVAAKSPAPWRRVHRHACRHPRSWWLSTGLLLTVVVAVAYVFLYREKSEIALWNLRSERERSELAARNLRVEREKSVVEQLLRREDVETAGWRREELDALRNVAVQTQEIQGLVAFDLFQLDAEAAFESMDFGATALSIDRSGKVLVAAHEDGGAVRIDLSTGAQERISSEGHGPVGFLPEGLPWMLSGWRDERGERLRMDFPGSGRPSREFLIGDVDKLFSRPDCNDRLVLPVCAVDASAERVAAVLLGEDQDLSIVTWSDRGEPDWRVELPASALAFSPDREYLACGTWSGDVEILRVLDGQIFQTLRPPEEKPARSIAFGAERSSSSCGVWGVVGVGYLGGGIDLWRCRRDSVHRYELSGGDSEEVRGLAFGGDGNVLVSTGTHYSYIWDTATRTPLLRLPYRNHGVAAVVAAHGTRLAVASIDCSVYSGAIDVWNLSEVAGVSHLRGLDAPVAGVSASADARLVAAWTTDFRLGVWSADSGELQFIVKSSDRWPMDSDVCFSGDSSELILASYESLTSWNVRDPSPEGQRWTLPRGLDNRFVVRNGDVWLVRADLDSGSRVVRVRSYPGLDVLGTIDRFPSFVAKIVVRPSGDRALVEGMRGDRWYLGAFELPSGRMLWERPARRDAAVSLDPTGEFFAFHPVDEDRGHAVLRVADGTVVAERRGYHSDAFTFVADHAWGAQVADGTLRFFAMSATEPFLSVPFGRGVVHHLPDGRLGWGSEDGDVVLFDLARFCRAMTERGFRPGSSAGQ